MKLKYFLISLLLTSACASYAQVNLSFKNGSHIYFTEKEVTEINQSPSIPSQIGFRVSFDFLESLNQDTREKLSSVFNQDLISNGNDEYAKLLEFLQISPLEATELRLKFLEQTATEVINLLKKDPKIQVRILARDMNEVYSQIEGMLTLQNKSLSSTERFNILERIRLVPASRLMIDRIISAPNAKENILSLFQINEHQLENERFILLDSGYEGSIARKLQPYFERAVANENLRWFFIWRAPNAPAYVSQFKMPSFDKYLIEHGLYDRFYIADKQYSFRVAMIEHYPKYTGRTYSWSDKQLIIMLDLDDTVLKEVDFQANRMNPQVQAIRYKPSIEAAKKYRSRLTAQPDPTKVIHFNFFGDEIESTVVVRPAIESFINELEPLIQSNRVRLLITSNNDPERTIAVWNQLKIAGKSLREIGAEVISPRLFNDEKFRKDIGLLRSNLNIPDNSTLVAIDDLPNNYVVSGSFDFVQPVYPFNGDYVHEALRENISEVAVRDLAQFNRIREFIFSSILLSEDQTPLNRLKAVAFVKGQFESLKNSMSLKEINSCELVFGGNK